MQYLLNDAQTFSVKHFPCSKKHSPLALSYHTARFSPFLPFWLLAPLPPSVWQIWALPRFCLQYSALPLRTLSIGESFTAIVTSIISKSETEFSSFPYHPLLHLVLSYKFPVGHFFAHPHLTLINGICLNITHYLSSIASPPKLPLTSATDDAHTAWFGNPDPIMLYCHTDIPKQAFLLDSELDKNAGLGSWIPSLSLSQCHLRHGL